MTDTSDQTGECPYIVLVGDNYHYMDDDSEYQEGRYRTWEEAVERCKGIVDACLKHLHEPGMSAGRLWSQYVMFGEDPFVVPRDGVGFSAWKYARRRCAEISLPPQEADTESGRR